MNTQMIKHFVQSNGIAWPGCYPMYAICADGEVLSAKAVRQNYKQVLQATKNPGTNRQWEIVGIDIHWEGEPLYCSDSGEPIESAYGVPE